MIADITMNLQKLRATKPIVLNLANYVTMDIMANGLLAVGAAPIMTVCEEELAELVQLAHAVNINIGTVDQSFMKRCSLAAALAKQYQKPIIFDPVGAGASGMRTTSAMKIMPYASIIKGNASEIMALFGNNGQTLGVESSRTVDQAKKAAQELAVAYGCTVVITGEVDFITDGTQEANLPYGSSLMAKVTGIGCTLGAIIAAFRGVMSDDWQASLVAVATVGLSGQVAKIKAQGPGSFKTCFIDQLYAPDIASFQQIMSKVSDVLKEPEKH